jgi:NRPS condensation-like uncharacterized protein
MEMRNLFQHPNIKNLCRYVKTGVKEIYQEVVKGEVEQTPIQKWFFEEYKDETHHFNQAVMLYRKEGFLEDTVRKVFDKIVEHHDALRIVYIKEENRIFLYNRSLDCELYSFEVFDLVKQEEYEEKIKETVNCIQSSIDLKKGPLVKLGLFKTPEGEHLLIVIHHLVVDGVSWRIIFEDFNNGYNQAINGEEIKLQDKTDSYKEWAWKLKEYSSSKEVLKEITYWKKIEDTEITPLKKDKKITVSKQKDSQVVNVELTKEETEKLLKRANEAYNTRIDDLLLTALGLAVKEWGGEEKVLVNMEGHGRE